MRGKRRPTYLYGKPCNSRPEVPSPGLGPPNSGVLDPYPPLLATLVSSVSSTTFFPAGARFMIAAMRQRQMASIAATGKQ